ncbi:unnamed protein product [Agarophyton chilense]
MSHSYTRLPRHEADEDISPVLARNHRRRSIGVMDSRQATDSDFIPPSVAPPAPEYIPPDFNSGDARVPLPREQEWATKRLRFSSDTWGTKSSAAGSQALFVKKTSRAACVGRWVSGIVLILVILISVAFFFKRDSFYTATLRKQGIPPGLYSRNGYLYVGKDTPFRIKGFSWYGLEEPAHLPGGMTYTSVVDILEFTNRHEFNAIRLPLSVENIMSNSLPDGGITPFKNPEISGLPYLDMVLQIVRMAADRHILILLDIHRLESHEVKSKGLWYSDAVPEERLMHVWDELCDIFKDEWNVLGADLFNEPWDSLWNSTKKAEDWKTASENLGNLVHKKCPSWLLLVEGVGDRAGGTETYPFWAENLAVMENSPPEPVLRNKVALSPHVYGPGVWPQDYFKSPDFADDMPSIWDNHFGKASAKTGLATVVGEWGGIYEEKDKTWQQAFMKYILEKKMGFFYWCINPESGDTGGLLKSDWKTEETEKLRLISQAPSTSVKDNARHFQYWRTWQL